MKTPEGLNRYVESCSTDSYNYRKVESASLKESYKGTKFIENLSATEDCWWVPISFYNRKNLNGRVYNKKLWENVINRQRETWQGSAMLLDHPNGDSDGTPEKICGVWLDMKLDKPIKNGEGLVWGLLCPSGRAGEDLKDFFKKGGRIGTSSSGFGRLMDDDCTVDPDSFQLERCGDWVLNPSQSTYFGIGEDGGIEDRSIKESDDDSYYESVQKSTNSIEEKATTNKETHNMMMSKLEKKAFRKNLEEYITEASKIEDVEARLKEYTELLSCAEEDEDCKDLSEKLNSLITNEQSFISKAIEEKVAMKERFGIEDTRDLEVKLTNVANDKLLKEKEANDWKEVAEGLRAELLKVNEELDNRHSNSYVAYLKEKSNKLQNDITTITESSKEEINSLKEQVASVNTKLEESENLRKTAEERTLKLAEATRRMAEKMAEDSETSKTRLNESTSKASELETRISTLEEENANLKKALEEANKSNESYKVVLNEMKGRQTSLIEGTKALKESKNEVIEKSIKLSDEIERYARADKSRKVKEARQKRLENRTEQEVYYESLLIDHGKEITPFKEDIIGARSLMEAKQIYWKDILPRLEEKESPVERKRLRANESREESEIGLPKGWL